MAYLSKPYGHEVPWNYYINYKICDIACMSWHFVTIFLHAGWIKCFALMTRGPGLSKGSDLLTYMHCWTVLCEVFSYGQLAEYHKEASQVENVLLQEPGPYSINTNYLLHTAQIKIWNFSKLHKTCNIASKYLKFHLQQKADEISSILKVLWGVKIFPDLRWTSGIIQ